MELIPALKIGWMNGWTLLVAFYAVFGLLIFAFPQNVVERLYDRSGWGDKIRRVNKAAKLVAVLLFLLIFLSPLKARTGAFVPGITFYLLGFLLMIIALVNYRRTPTDEPVVKGAYQFSRNPQWVALIAVVLGVALTIGSWIALLLVLILTTLGHFRILAEEEACLDQYGESYQTYMKKFPRYLLFF